MSFTCNTNDFPRQLSSYADARRHFDSVKPWRGDHDSAPRPIGTRGHKHKNMRELGDGSIAFRLYSTDCVIWHPDNTVTAEGYSSMSTTAFMSDLLPPNVTHGQGGGRGGPILYLHSTQNSDDWRGYWRDAKVVNCSRPVRLHYNARWSEPGTASWRPIDEDALEPFRVHIVDRKASREARRKYNLADFEAVVDTVIALAGDTILPDTDRVGDIPEIMDALEKRDLGLALALCPRGEKRQTNGYHAFSRQSVSDKALRPGFLQQLRDHIYEQEGAIKVVEERVLSLSAYKRHLLTKKRFD